MFKDSTALKLQANKYLVATLIVLGGALTGMISDFVHVSAKNNMIQPINSALPFDNSYNSFSAKERQLLQKRLTDKEARLFLSNMYQSELTQIQKEEVMWAYLMAPNKANNYVAQLEKDSHAHITMKLNKSKKMLTLSVVYYTTLSDKIKENT